MKTTTKFPLRTVSWVIAIVALLLSTSFGAFAGLNAEAMNMTALGTSVGTLNLTLSSDTYDLSHTSAGFNSAISGMVPGGTVNRYIQLASPGTLTNTSLGLLLTHDVGDNADLVGTGAKALQITVSNCTSAWVSGECPALETEKLLISQRAVGSFTSKVAFSNITTLVTPNVLHLKISIALDGFSETSTNGTPPAGTVQGQSAHLTFTFSGVQQTGTPTIPPINE